MQKEYVVEDANKKLRLQFVYAHPRETLKKAAIWCCAILVVMGVGAVLDSSAMQWAGFLFAFLLVSLVVATKKDRCSIDEAIYQLQKLKDDN